MTIRRALRDVLLVGLLVFEARLAAGELRPGDLVAYLPPAAGELAAPGERLMRIDPGTGGIEMLPAVLERPFDAIATRARSWVVDSGAVHVIAADESLEFRSPLEASALAPLTGEEMLVGRLESPVLVRVDHTGAVLRQYDAGIHSFGIHSLDVSRDGCVAYFTETNTSTGDPSGAMVHRYDLCADRTLSPLTWSVAAPPATAVRVLRTGDVLVGDQEGVTLFSSEGVSLRRYQTSRGDAMVIAPSVDGLSFYAGGTSNRISWFHLSSSSPMATVELPAWLRESAAGIRVLTVVDGWRAGTSVQRRRPVAARPIAPNRVPTRSRASE